MESSLRPRDIQARIRAGESLEDVARAAGVPPERIEAFAAPVLAERAHVAGLARTHPVRRRGETQSVRSLTAALAEGLTRQQVDPRDLRWDAWRREDRRWQVIARFGGDGEGRTAEFYYDQAGRFTVAANDEARGLIGDAEPSARTASADDELAIVRAIQPDPDEEPTTWLRRDDGDSSDAEDAYSEPEFAEVDGLFDIVPREPNEIDVLYDMLASFDEDSVKIYAGLVHPPESEVPVALGASDSDGALVATLASEVAAQGETDAGTSTETEAATQRAPLRTDGEPEAGLEAAPDSREGAESEAVLEASAEGNHAAPVNAEAGEAHQDAEVPPPASAAAPPEPEAAVASGPSAVLEPPAASVAPEPGAGTEREQPSLVEGAPPARPEPKKPARKRAQVPTWDEIMFGSPKPEQ